MNNNFALYKDNPTAGEKDGTKISDDGSMTQALSATLDSTNNEEAVIKCAVRCDDGYKIPGDTIINFEGPNANKWKVASDFSYSSSDIASQMCSWQDQIVVNDVNNTNKIFWAKASSQEGEAPSNDSSTKIVALGQVFKET